MAKVQISTERDIKAGDLFMDGDGVFWVALFDPAGPPSVAAVVYHTNDATDSVPEGEIRPFRKIAQPFNLVAALEEITRA